MTIVLAGGSGFLGGALKRALLAEGHTVRVLTRRQASRPDEVQWQPDGGSGAWASTLHDAHAIVNLAGEGIADRRWSKARKEALRTSRVLPARSLARALADAPPRERLLVTSSAIGYYGPRGDEPVTEEDGPGDDFLSRLCVEWEREAAAAASETTRVALVRTGLVLHPGGGALKTMLLPFRLGLGGPLGSGRQYWSWIHLADWVALLQWLIATRPVPHNASGTPAATPFNATAPVPVTNAEFSRALGRVLHRPALLPAPEFALRIVVGEFAMFLTTGARVLPARTQREGFRFRFERVEDALRDLLQAPAG